MHSVKTNLSWHFLEFKTQHRSFPLGRFWIFCEIKHVFACQRRGRHWGQREICLSHAGPAQPAHDLCAPPTSWAPPALPPPHGHPSPSPMDPCPPMDSLTLPHGESIMKHHQSGDLNQQKCMFLFWMLKVQSQGITRAGSFSSCKGD